MVAVGVVVEVVMVCSGFLMVVIVLVGVVSLVVILAAEITVEVVTVAKGQKPERVSQNNLLFVFAVLNFSL